MLKEVDSNNYIFFMAHGQQHSIPKYKIRDLFDEPRIPPKTEMIPFIRPYEKGDWFGKED
mgnify:CR=1 FL=1